MGRGCIPEHAVHALARPQNATAARLAVSMAAMALGMISRALHASHSIEVLVYFAVGSARGAGGVGLSSALMETVVPHFMGRVQNTFIFGI